MTDQHTAYTALRDAAARIGSANYRNGLYRPLRRNGVVVQGYSITAEHRAVIDAMGKVLAGTMTPAEGMSLLWDYDVMKQRLA